MNRRIKLLFFWATKAHKKVSLFSLLQVILGKRLKSQSRKHISSISTTGKFHEVKIKHYGNTLYFPISMPLKSLYQVLEESLNPKDWHFFEIPRTKVEKDDVVLDCGAAEGVFSFLIASKCSKVYAIEPLPLFVEALKKTFAQTPNIEIIPVALSNESGSGFLNNDDISSTVDEKGEIPITLQTIDNLFFRKGLKVNYIKADLEGFEIKMLEGAKETIKQNKPKIAITTYHNKDHSELIEKILREYNPSYNFITKGIEPWSGGPVMLHAWDGNTRS
jgi:FkbM family methyltransferase